MRLRLMATYVSLLAMVLLGLSFPLGMALLARDEHAMVLDRLSDAARFAALAEPVVRKGVDDDLTKELRAYERLYGVVAGIVDARGQLRFTSESKLDTSHRAVRDSIQVALSGRRAGPDGTFWPWRTDPLVVAEPIGSGGDVIGAAVTVSPVSGLNAATRRSWTVLGLVGFAVLVLGAVAAVPLSRWMLRPIVRLDLAAHALADGRYSGAPLGDSGPPELRRLGQSFTSMASRLTILLGRQRTFVSYASHQLRTPLATLRLCVDNLQPAVKPDGIDDYRLLSDEIERMARMCDSLLSYALAEVAASERNELDAAAIADARVAVWRPAAEHAGINLSRQGVPYAAVLAAPEALDQALDALVSNAIKFAGREAAVVVWVVRTQPQWVEIHVIDSGPGMPVEDLARVTEAFWRRPSDQNVDGSGLGITIAEALIKASGGQLELAPASPHGVHARIRLPAGAR